MAGKVTTQLVIDGKNTSQKAFTEVNRDLGLLNKTLASTGKAIAGYLSFNALTSSIKAVANTADQFQLMNARLRLATGSQQEFNTASKELQRIAVDTGSPLESLVTLYGRISRPLKEAGRSQEDILKVTEAVAVSFRVSGASAEEAQNGVIQFAQALGSGALRGDEFNSVAEQAPRLMQALADGIGVPTSALKGLAAEGKLTAQVVTEALIGQLPQLTTELAGFGDTVGKEITAIQDVVSRGIGQADTGPLIDALKELRATLGDQQIQANLTTLAAALAKLAAVAVQGGAEFAGLGDDIGYLAARLAGNVTELDHANKEIAKLQAADNGVGMLDLYMSDEAIKKSLKEWQDYRDKLLEQQTGMTADARAAAEETSKQVQAVDDARRAAGLSLERSYIESLQSIRDQQVDAKEAQLKAEQALEKKALSDIEKIRQDRLAIEQRYSEAIAGFNSTTGGGTYSDANALKVAARQALANGDVAGAQKQAQAALKILQDLQSAGESTYGFTGFAKELQAIELSANDLQKSQADTKLQAIRQSMEDIKASAEQLQNLPITLNLAPEQVEAVKTQLQALAGTEVVIPVKLQPTAEMSAIGLQPTQQVTFPGYATGGHVRGPGSGTSDSIMARLSNGEFVMRAAAVQHFGSNLLERMNGLQVPRFAEGGLVDAALSAPAGADFPDLGRLEFAFGGQSYEMYAPPSTAKELRTQRLKFGRTKK